MSAESIRDRKKPRWRVRGSSIHGRGAFCTAPISEGELVGAYSGSLITAEQAAELYGRSPHTFLFLRSDGLIVDGGQGGNGTRFINHGCEPNVESYEQGGRILLGALRSIAPGEELLLDYRLDVEPGDELLHPCRCASPRCRGTMVLRED